MASEAPRRSVDASANAQAMQAKAGSEMKSLSSAGVKMKPAIVGTRTTHTTTTTTHSSENNSGESPGEGGNAKMSDGRSDVHRASLEAPGQVPARSSAASPKLDTPTVNGSGAPRNNDERHDANDGKADATGDRDRSVESSPPECGHEHGQ